MKILFAIIAILIIINLYRRNKRNDKKSTQNQKLKLKQQSKEIPIRKSNPKETESITYKAKKIRRFNMKGMYYRNLNPETDSGFFIGKAECESNFHDKYAVGIHNEDNKLLGYISKGNKLLNNSIKNWHQGSVMAFGNVWYDDFNEKWEGFVNIPAGLKETEINKIKTVLNLIKENEKRIRNKDKSSKNYIKILNNHNKIKELLNELKNPEEILYDFPNNLIPSISKHFEKEKEWRNLLFLEKFQPLIDRLNENFQESTKRRILKAKEKL